MAKIRARTLRFTVLGLAVLLVIGGRWLIAGAMSLPDQSFDLSPLPAAPDYARADHWAALPDKEDGADQLPPDSGFVDRQASAVADVFFVHPTSAFYGDTWNAPMGDRLSNLIVESGTLPQQASVFNAAGKIYAPRYRSVRMAVWSSPDKDSEEKAVALAYSDVRAAFNYYLQHYNQGRPIILASHSQGTLLLRQLLKDEFDGKPLARRLVVAYLIGNSVPLDDFSAALPLCASAEKTGCYVSWNTMLDGGDSYHWVKEAGVEQIACVNPLSWRADMHGVDKSENPGAIPMIGLSGLAPMDKQLVGARCGAEGMLWIDKPEAPGYTRALFKGGSYHTYDINLYYASLRRNVQLRLSALANIHLENR